MLIWPGMSAEIKDSIGKCDTCNSYQLYVAVDLFTFNNKEWFTIVDY